MKTIVTLGIAGDFFCCCSRVDKRLHRARWGWSYQLKDRNGKARGGRLLLAQSPKLGDEVEVGGGSHEGRYSNRLA